MSYTFDELDTEMGDRQRMVIKRSNMQTHAERLDDGGIGIYLAETRILEFQPDGRVILDNGGWVTVTTKARLNDYLPSPWGISQEKGVWYLRNWHDRETYPFANGMVIDGDSVNGAMTEYEFDMAKSLRKAIKAYASGFMADLKEAKIDPDGSCWVCASKGALGNDHILSHMDEQYYPAALLRNAVEDFPVSKWATYLIHSALFEGTPIPERDHAFVDRQVKKSLVKYLEHHFANGGG